MDVCKQFEEIIFFNEKQTRYTESDKNMDRSS